MKNFLLLAIAALPILTTAQNIPSYVPINGLVGWWPFNGNANDESGNGNNGTVNGAVLTSDRYGNLSNAYSFDGVDDGIIMTDSNFPMGSSDRSISFWINDESVGNYCSIPLRYGAHSPNNGCWILHSNLCNINYPSGTLRADFYNSGVWSNITMPNNQWRMITMTLQNQICTIYLDTTVIGQAQITANTISVNNKFYIGSDSVSLPSNFFNGKLDDIGIWSRALSAQEIMNLYNGSITTNNCLPIYVPTNGLVGFWPFCGNANDESGNGKHGIVNGAALTVDRYANVNHAFEFNGTNNHIVIDSLNIGTPNNASSLSVWWKQSPNINSGWGTILGDYDSPSGGDFVFSTLVQRNFSSGFNTINRRSSSIEIQTYSNAFIDSAWHHTVVVFDGFSRLYYYSDNVLEDSMIVWNGISNGNFDIPFYNPTVNYQDGGKFRIGCSNYNNNLQEFWNGKIDDIGIWNRALTTQEIYDLYVGQITTDISQHTNENEIKIFPNPAKDLVNISLNRKGNTKLNLMDSSGRLVRTFHVSTAQSQLSLEGLESGIYFLKVEGENKLVKKVIKE